MSGLSFTGSHCNGPLHGVLCFNVRHSRRSLSRGDAAGTVLLSRDRKLEIFISNAAYKVREDPPLQVIFMEPPRSNELIFTFYAFILVCPRRILSVPPIPRRVEKKKKRMKKVSLSLFHKILCRIPLIGHVIIEFTNDKKYSKILTILLKFLNLILQFFY